MGSDLCQLVPKTGRHEAFHLVCEETQGRKECAEECFGEDTHELRKLMREHGQHGSEGAKACCEEDEEGKLFLWVHGHLVERGQQLPICRFCASWVGVEQVTLLQRVGNYPEGC